ncbi:hypothetical protein Mgra_00009741, partial [Meloidogyne graminicola]
MASTIYLLCSILLLSQFINFGNTSSCIAKGKPCNTKTPCCAGTKCNIFGKNECDYCIPTGQPGPGTCSGYCCSGKCNNKNICIN